MGTTLQLCTLHKVRRFAIEAHQDHFYPDGRHYFTHLEAVAYLAEKAFEYDSSFDLERAVILAYLHDSIEDTSIDFIDIMKSFGVEIASDVSALTKDKSLPKKEQIIDSLGRILNSSREAMVVKLADRIANLQQTIFLIDNKWTKEYKRYYKIEAELIKKSLGHASKYLESTLNSFILLY